MVGRISTPSAAAGGLLQLLHFSFCAMTSTTILVAGGVCAGVAVLTALSLWSRAQALPILRNWAQREGLELLSARRRSFVPLWVPGKGHQFFRVSVRTSAGEIRRAWIQCLDFNSTELHNIHVKWDESSTA